MRHWHKLSVLVLAGLVWVSPLRGETVRIGYPSLATGFAPSWVTAETGMWKRQGLDVQLIYLRGGSRSVSALLGGSVDIVLGSDLGVTIALLQGAALTRVGVTTNTTGYSVVTQPGIRNIRDLRGKILGITPGRDAAYARLVKILRENGLDAGRDVTFIAVADGGPAARVAALANGLIHATMFTPPSDLIAQRLGMKILAKIDVANVGGGLNTTAAYLLQNQPIMIRFLKGYMEGIHYLKSHREESLKIFSKYVRNPDRDIMANLYEEISTRVEPSLRPQSEAVRALLDLVAQDYPQAQRLTETDNWNLTLIDEIQRSGFLEQLYKK